MATLLLAFNLRIAAYLSPWQGWSRTALHEWKYKYKRTQIHDNTNSKENTNTTVHLPSLTLAGAVTQSPPPIVVEMSWKILTTSSSESFNSTGHKAGEISQHWWWMAGIGIFHSDFSPAPGAPDHQQAALHQLVAPSSPELKATCGSGRSATSSSSSSVSNKPPSSSVLHVCAYYSQPALHNMSLCWRRRADRPAAASISQDMRVRLSQMTKGKDVDPESVLCDVCEDPWLLL